MSGFDAQLRKAAAETADWPEWARREAGLTVAERQPAPKWHDGLPTNTEAALADAHLWLIRLETDCRVVLTEESRRRLRACIEAAEGFLPQEEEGTNVRR